VSQTRIVATGPERSPTLTGYGVGLVLVFTFIGAPVFYQAGIKAAMVTSLGTFAFVAVGRLLFHSSYGFLSGRKWARSLLIILLFSPCALLSLAGLIYHGVRNFGGNWRWHHFELWACPNLGSEFQLGHFQLLQSLDKVGVRFYIQRGLQLDPCARGIRPRSAVRQPIAGFFFVVVSGKSVPNPPENGSRILGINALDAGYFKAAISRLEVHGHKEILSLVFDFHQRSSGVRRGFGPENHDRITKSFGQVIQQYDRKRMVFLLRLHIQHTLMHADRAFWKSSQDLLI